MLKNILKILLIPMACWAFFVACTDHQCSAGDSMSAHPHYECSSCEEGKYQRMIIYQEEDETFTGVKCSECNGTIVRDKSGNAIGCMPAGLNVPAGSYLTETTIFTGSFDTAKECPDGTYQDEHNQITCKRCDGKVIDRTHCLMSTTIN